MQKIMRHALKMALAAAEGLDGDGGLWYEREGEHLMQEKHWWPQAEAMIGFFNAWQVSRDDRWLERSAASWTAVFRGKSLTDGEAFTGVNCSWARIRNPTMINATQRTPAPARNPRYCLFLLTELMRLLLSV